MKTRRQFLLNSLLSATLARSGTLLAQQRVLPLNTPGIDHLDIIVPDPETSARFYMQLFNTALHAQPFRGAQRYFILFGDMNVRREVGYMAIGAANGRETGIGHFCTSVVDWRENSNAIWEAMAEEFSSTGLGDFPGSTGFGGLFEDPDGIEIQFLPSPDTLVTAATPSDLVAHHQGLITPLSVDHVMLNVSDLDAALRWYRILYGPENGYDGNTAWFEFPLSNTRLELQESSYGYNKQPGIDHFGIKTLPFAANDIVDFLNFFEVDLANISSENGMVTNLTFTDPDGITISLNPV